MDVVLEVLDYAFFDKAYATLFPSRTANTSSIVDFIAEEKYFLLPPTTDAFLSALPRDNMIRQTFSLWLVTWVFGVILYFLFSGLSYRFIFDHATFQHPKFLKNQVHMEIRQSMESLPVMSVCTAFAFMMEVRGHSLLYMSPAEYGWTYAVLQFPIFLLFTDCFIYLIHRGLHHKVIYKRLHKPHHKWIVPTPFASYAFHPLDGFAQSIPYHLFVFLFPLQKFAYIGLFVFVNIWTILIHDGEYLSNNAVINSAACHSVHHLYFNHNYGQYTTLWDRLGGSYRRPDAEFFDEKLKMNPSTWKQQSKEMEHIVDEVEDGDDRVYGNERKMK